MAWAAARGNKMATPGPRTPVKPGRPNLADVLAHVQPGNALRLNLTREQKKMLADHDGRLALNVVRHLLAARVTSLQPDEPPERFPLTEPTFTAIARKLGPTVGIKRARILLRRLRAANVLQPDGSYVRNHGHRYRVALYRLVGGLASLRSKHAVGRGRIVKRKKRFPYWEHTLFGEPDGLPPPGLTRAQKRRMRRRGELERVQG